MATPLLCHGPGWRMVALTARGWLFAVLGRGMGSSRVGAGVGIWMDGITKCLQAKNVWLPRNKGINISGELQNHVPYGTMMGTLYRYSTVPCSCRSTGTVPV